MAAELVADAGVAPGEIAVDVGAGTGRLTDALVAAGARVVAIELDAALARRLAERYRGDARVTVVAGDALQAELPGEPFRVVANLPFAGATSILRRLLEPTSALVRADVILQDGAARKRSSVRPSTFLSLSWLPWWRLARTRHLAARSFQPPPAVDAAVLAAARREPPLLAPAERDAYVRLLAAAFERAPTPVVRSLRDRLDGRAAKALLAERGLPRDARAFDLDVFDWVALFQLSRRRR